MKKIIAMTLLSVMMVFGLVACGDKEEPVTSQSTPISDASSDVSDLTGDLSGTEEMDDSSNVDADVA